MSAFKDTDRLGCFSNPSEDSRNCLKFLFSEKFIKKCKILPVYLCSNSSVSGTPYCPWQNISASKQNQNPYHLWSSTPYTDTTNCADGGRAYVAYNLNEGLWRWNRFCATTIASNGYTHFGSVRCCFGFRKKAEYTFYRLVNITSYLLCLKYTVRK